MEGCIIWVWWVSDMNCSYMYYSMFELKNNCCIGVEKEMQKHTVVINLVFPVHKIVEKRKRRKQNQYYAPIQFW